MASQTVLLSFFCLSLVCLLAPVLADFDTYLRLGTQASQMQSWKIKTRDHITSLEALSGSLIGELENLNTSVKAALDQATSQVNGLELMADDLINRLTQLEQNYTAPADYEAPPAFQAYVAGGGISFTPFSTITIKYTDVSLSSSDYSSSTGLFTAPVTGLYWFHATFTAPGGTREAVLKKTTSSGSSVIGYMYYYGSQETACTTAVLLYASETVGVYPMTSDFGSTWSMDAGYGNTFAGYLIAKYDPPATTP